MVESKLTCCSPFNITRHTLEKESKICTHRNQKCFPQFYVSHHLYQSPQDHQWVSQLVFSGVSPTNIANLGSHWNIWGFLTHPFCKHTLETLTVPVHEFVEILCNKLELQCPYCFIASELAGFCYWCVSKSILLLCRKRYFLHNIYCRKLCIFLMMLHPVPK